MSLRGPLPAIYLLSLSILGIPAWTQTMTRAQSIEHEKQAIHDLIARYGGYEVIEEALVPFQKEAGKIFGNDRNRPKVGKHKYASSISVSALKNEWKVNTIREGQVEPMDVILEFDREMKKIGVQLIMVPVPGKIEAHPEEFKTNLPAGMPVNTGRLKAQLALLEKDVETINILPSLLQNNSGEALPLYELSGHHPSGLGAKIAGELIGSRLQRFNLEGADPTRFMATRRNATERIDRKVPMVAWEVTYADGTTYDHSQDSPIIVTGDSHAFAYGKASWACHIARVTGLPVTDVSTSGGGPTGGQRVADFGLENLKHRKVVVWIFTSSNLERFAWSPIQFSDSPTLSGLITLNRIDEALTKYHKLKQTAPEQINLSENRLNNLGYQLLGTAKFDQAISIFKIITLEFPNSANAWDSLGEGLVRADRKDEAIASFNKSLSLYPSNATKANSLKYLQRLGVAYREPEPYQISGQAIAAIVGDYHFTKEMKGTVHNDNGKVVIDVTGQPRFTLQPISDVDFVTPEGVTVTFAKDDEGAVEKLIAVVNGRRREAFRDVKNM